MTQPELVVAKALATVHHNRTAAAAVNSVRVSSVMNRLTEILTSHQTIDITQFSSNCLSLSRGIDYAVANNEKPDGSKILPSLIKQLCDRISSPSIQAITMVLLISVKNAGKVGWFSEVENEEIIALANKIGSNFNLTGDVASVSNADSIIATVMERFYPQMVMGHIFTTFEVKSGYGVHTNDFPIQKSVPYVPEDRIRLFIAQVDCLDTSACIISPQQVNFIINGRAVDKRTNITMDSGPQLPTIVTALLKYGTNLIQAVGEFRGNYLVVIAFMRERPLPAPLVLLDYVQPLVDGSDSDPDLIEGPSRISLNCPITRSRIKIPVKGHSCKHHQCFDFNNFTSINSRRPSWRCPHCNQSVCYTDIRVDQNMAEVLKEVGENVVDIIIFSDGSWKAVFENDDDDQACDINLTSLPETSKHKEPTEVPNDSPGVIDLSLDDDDGAMDIVNILEIVEEAKPSVADLLAPLDSDDTNGVNQNVAAPIDDDFWAGLNVPSGLETAAWSDQMFTGLPLPQPLSVAPVLGPTEPSGPLPQMQFMNPIPTNEYGMSPSVTRAVTRTPVAIQALPAQLPGAPGMRPVMNYSTPTPTVVSQPGLSSHTADGLRPICSDLEREQLLSRSLISQPQATPVVSSDPTQQQQHHHFVTPNQNHPNTYRTSLAELQNPHLQLELNPRGQSSNGIRSSSPPHLSRTPQVGAQASPLAGTQQTRMGPSPMQLVPPQMGGRQHPVGPGPGQTPRPVSNFPPTSTRLPSGAVLADSSPNGLVDLTPDHNRRSAARMRGSLAGRDFLQYRDQVIQPTQQQQSQPTRSPSIPVSAPMTILPQFQALLENQRAGHGSQPHNGSSQT